jgi:hypothetical protein
VQQVILTQEQTSQPEQKTAATQALQASQTELIGDLEVKVIVDGKNVNDGDSVKVKPDKEFKVKIELKNNAVNEKEIDVNAKLNDFDQEESDSLTLKAGESEQLKYTFDIPRLTDDDQYPLVITVNEKKWEIKLKIDKPSHEITIESSVDPEKVPCEGTYAKLKARIENTGKNDEEGTIKIESNTLKLLDEWPFDLPEGESHLFEKTISALAPGEHDISVKALYGSRTSEAHGKLTVESCKKEEIQKVQIEPEERLAMALSDKKTAAPAILEELPVVDIMTITFLTLTGAFAVLILAFALPKIFR